MASVFSRIVSGQIPAYVVAETELYLAFLDVNPLKKGHVLVIPKEETDYIFDLPDELFCGLQLFAKRVAFALKKAVPCNRVGVAVIGLEVPHAHIHLIPIDNMNDMNFANPKLSFSPEEMESTAAKIKAEFI